MNTLDTFDPNGVGLDNGAYFGLPFTPDEARLVLISAPWDVTVSYGTGTSEAPDAIIEASMQLDLCDALSPGAWRLGIATADIDYSLLETSQRLRSDAERVIRHLEEGGSVADDAVCRKIRRVNEGCVQMNENIRAQARAWLAQGKLVGLVGGDHSTPYGLVQALGERGEGFGILHIDAHCDLRRAYEGFEYSHASIMYNVLRDVPQAERIVEVGVRDYCDAEAELARSSELRRRNMGCDLPPHRGRTARTGLCQLRHRRPVGRILPPYRYARRRRADLQSGRLPAARDGAFGAPDHRFRRGGGRSPSREFDRRLDGCAHPLQTLRTDP